VPPEKRSFAKDRDLAKRAGSIGGTASKGGGRMKASAAERKRMAEAAKWDGN
jgi:general stress protein YciG